MLKNLFKVVFGDKNTKAQKELWPVVNEINEIYQTLQNLTDDELRGKITSLRERLNEETRELREKIDEHNTRLKSDDEKDMQKVYDELDEVQAELDEKYEELLDEILPEVFAIVKDTCRRLVGSQYTVMGHKVTWDMVPYDVQLMGGIVLHQGKIAEMATGEGKTLVATLPIFLNALTGRGVHLVTVNDYLAQRDAEWMGEIYKFHGLTVGVILTNMSPEKRRESYNSDIVYGTNNEFGFDYLRDNMASDSEYQVQRDHIYAIVDEVDSVLIDEARTPLIISGPVDDDNQKFDEMKPKIERLFKIQNDLVASILKQGEDMMKNAPSKDQMTEAGVHFFRAYRGLPKHSRLLKVMAEPEYRKLIQETELEYLREKGKNMHIIDDELFFVIDEKNNTIELTDKGREELARGAREDKTYFVLPDLGTEIHKFRNDSSLTDADRLKKEEELNREFAEKSDRLHTINQLLKAYALFQKDDEYVVTDDGKIAIVDEFTGRILPGRRYSDGLHQAIEAKENVKVERDSQTLATITLQNYFRMYKKLAGMTGTAETEESEFFQIYKLEVIVIPTNKPITRDDLDDLIYKTKREKFKAVIDKVTELKAAGRPVLVGTTSVEVSETLSRMLKMKGIAHNVLNAKQHQREAEIVAFAGQPGAITIATNMAGRGTDIKLGSGVLDKGGLYIIGTERHEARRIDRQLRGRSGRQGDPGTTQFYISLEDDLMRLFGSERAAPIMSRLGLNDGEVITHPIITKSVERAQKKVEENNFAIRKRLLEYDDVMNQQRTIIYDKRNKALKGQRLKNEILDMMAEVVEETVEKYFEEGNLEAIQREIALNFLTNIEFDPKEAADLGKAGVVDMIIDAVTAFYERKEEQLGHEFLARIERFAVLSVIDNKWKEHLRDMDDLKEGIGLRAYGQKDPLLEYKGESYKLFVELLNTIRNETVMFSYKFFPSEETAMQAVRRPARQRFTESKQSFEGYGGARESNQPAGRPQPVRVEEKVGRNDPCPCGSGKKYKNCHGKNA
ncbi:MAG: preprotein translocase subunit SecA [Ignavibacteriaceae bacterium]|nr:preprotein translocase subunit SecA [Ignavibacteriaceae bacterium]